DIPFFHLGAEAELTIDAMPGKTVRGTVALMEPQVGNVTRALRARIAVRNDDNSLRAGLFVRAKVSARRDTAHAVNVLVPSGAVQPLGERDVVFVEREAGLFEVRQVTVARRTPQICEIAEGLSKGERIVIAGAFLLRGEVTKQ